MTSTIAQSAPTDVRRVQSRDGTQIAYERVGAGAPLILIGGAFSDRKAKAAGLPLAKLLKDRFTVFAYDRRGRGDSTDASPYCVAREVEDLDALAAEAGQPVALFGMSSGAALALEAAGAGLTVTKVALYEPPYSMDAESQEVARLYDQKLQALIAAGDAAGAVALFMGRVGVPESMVDQMRKSPTWPGMLKMAPSLAQDAAVLGDAHGASVPTERIEQINAPILVLTGEKGKPSMQQAAEAIVHSARNGSRLTLPGQTHDVAIDVLAPALISFFARA